MAVTCRKALSIFRGITSFITFCFVVLALDIGGSLLMVKWEGGDYFLKFAAVVKQFVYVVKLFQANHYLGFQNVSTHTMWNL